MSSPNHPTHPDGWKLNGNDRSSWDLLWTCVSTIFACTWTTLHIHSRQISSLRFSWNKVFCLFAALLAPEMMVGLAIEECHAAYTLSKHCNKAFDRVEHEDTASQQQPRERVTKTYQKYRWGVIQGFCLWTYGVLFQTTDDWCLQVDKTNVIPLIEAGVIKPFHLKSTVIEDRSKADPFTKAFALLQSLWVTINVITRAASHLPVSPLEISTIAYVVCSATSYVAWWYKPKDMMIPIIIYVSYSSNDPKIPQGISSTQNKDCPPWIHISELFTEDENSSFFKPPMEIITRLLNAMTSGLRKSKKNQDPVNGLMGHANVDNTLPSIKKPPQVSKKNEPQETVLVTAMSGLALTSCYFVAGLVFCGIHLAAWNTSFPTRAEHICWRVFSLFSLGMTFPLYFVHAWDYFVFMRTKEGRQSSILKSKNRAKTIALSYLLFIPYSGARWGCIILMFIYLRAVPAGTYTTIDWLKTIPHI